MKKIFCYVASLLVATGAMVGCTEDITTDNLSNEGVNNVEFIEVVASLEADESRTTLLDNGVGKVAWSEGDAIGAIAEDGTITECVVTEINGSNAKFEVPAGTKYAVYPYASSDTFADGNLTKTLVNTVTLDGTNKVFGDKQNVMVAHLANNALSFKHLCGFVEVKLKGTGTVKHVALRSNSHNWDAMSGKGTINVADAANPTFTGTSDHSSTFNWVYANCSNVELSKSEATSFYFVVPPRTYENMAICVQTEAGSYAIQAKNAITVNRAKIRPITAIDIDNLKPATATNLAEAGMANCYVVPQGAKAKYYSFPARKINGTANLENVAYAHISWSESATLVTNVCYDAATGMVSFKYEGNNAEGNVQIALLDASHSIIWHNHIWCTDQPARLAITTPGKVYAILDRNLGATHTPADVADAAAISAEDATASYGLYYQYGRPTPFPRAKSATVRAENNAFKQNTNLAVQYAFARYNQHMTFSPAVNAYENALTYPKMFYYVGYNSAAASESTYVNNGSHATWYGKSVYNPFTDSDKLWHSENADVVSKKSDNDPCPAGYCVDDQTSVNAYLIGKTLTAATTKFGAYYKDAETKALLWLPYQGFRTYNTAKINYVGYNGSSIGNYNMWAAYTAAPANNLNCIRISGTTTPGIQEAYTQASMGAGIRCRAIDRSDLNQTEVVTKTFDGEGTEASPYLIKTADDLVKLSGLCNGAIEAEDDVDFTAAHYALAASIDMKSVTYNPITTFRGVFDGKKYAISNLTIAPSMGSAAMFVTIDGATIKNVILTNCTVTGTATNTHAGCIAAKITSGTIENCACYGSVNAMAYMGGIVGEVVPPTGSNVTIENCLFKGSLTVYSKNSYGWAVAGGIVGCIGNGNNVGDSNVTNCVALVDKITLNDSSCNPASGGLVGYAKKSVFNNCYTNLEVANIAYTGSKLQWGSLYGVGWWASNFAISNSYYVKDNKIGHNDNGTQNMVNVSELTIEEMTNGTLLDKLNDEGGEWTANSDGYPVPSAVLQLQ